MSECVCACMYVCACTRVHVCVCAPVCMHANIVDTGMLYTEYSSERRGYNLRIGSASTSRVPVLCVCVCACVCAHVRIHADVVKTGMLYI